MSCPSACLNSLTPGRRHWVRVTAEGPLVSSRQHEPSLFARVPSPLTGLLRAVPFSEKPPLAARTELTAHALPEFVPASRPFPLRPLP